MCTDSVWHVCRNDERYAKMALSLPREVIVHGTREQARALADLMSSNWPGCDYLFYVREDDEEE